MRTSIKLIAVVALGVLWYTGSHAAVITAIYGTGNGPDDWTANGPVALRSHVRYSIPGDLPQNIQNWNGVDTYSMAAGHPASHSTRGRWNIDFSIDNGDGNALSNYNYFLGFDIDPSQGTSFVEFNLMTNGVHTDHSLGNSSTAAGAGLEPGTGGNLAALLAALPNNSKAQNSFNMAFLDLTYNPDIDATYDFFLIRESNEGVEDRVDITVIVGAGGEALPEPMTLGLLGAGLAGIAALRRRKV